MTNNTATASATEAEGLHRTKPARRTVRHLVLWAIVLVVGNMLLLGLMVDLSGKSLENRFVEHFDNPLLMGWEHTPNVGVINGVLRMGPGTGAFIGCCWGNISLTVRARRLGNGYLSVGYRSGDMGGYGVHFGDNGVSLSRFFYGKDVELASTPIKIPAGTWVTIHVSAIGDTHFVSLDGETILVVYDANPFPPTGIGLVNDGTEGATAEFDDLIVLGDSDLEVAPAGASGAETSFPEE